MVASATRNGRRIIAVVLKASSHASLYKEAEELLDYGFTRFSDKLLAPKGQILESVTLQNGQTLKLSPLQDVYETIPNGEGEEFRLKVEGVNQEQLQNNGELQGTLNIYYKDKLVQSRLLSAELGVANAIPFLWPPLKYYSLLPLLVLLFLVLSFLIGKRGMNNRGK
ncbi:MAG: hypothetical protein GX434_18610 [Peptococcaceae bacterium]|nr:hypothetical protein [Peptococcaceae bacterium]